MITSRVVVDASAGDVISLRVHERGPDDRDDGDERLVASGELPRVLPAPSFAPEGADVVRVCTGMLTTDGDASVSASAVGRYLYTLLADAGLGDWLAEARESADGTRRVFLSVDDPTLRRLPWEMMIDPTTLWAPFLRQGNPWSRAGTMRADLTPLTPPVRILFVAGALGDVKLSAEDELDVVIRTFCRRPAQWHVEYLLAPTEREFDQTFREMRPHVLHLVTHGRLDRDGDYALELREGLLNPWDLRPMKIANDLPGSLRLVVLNACRSGVGSAAHPAAWSFADHFIARDARAVVTMQGDIPGSAGVAFATGFYEALTEGSPVDVAAQAGRNTISRANHGPESWALPSLVLAGAPESVLATRARAATPAIARVVAQVVSYVDRSQERRRLWSRTVPDDPTERQHLIVVTGDKKVGKSAVVKGALPACYARGCDIAYVDFDVHAGRLDWFRAVRRTHQQLAEWLPEHSDLLDECEHAIECLRTGPVVSRAAAGERSRLSADGRFENEADCGDQRKEEIFAQLRKLVAECAKRNRLLLVFDHVATALSDEARDDFVVPMLIRPLIDDPMSGVVVVVVVPSTDALDAALDERYLRDPIEVGLFDGQTVPLLLREFLSRNATQSPHELETPYASLGLLVDSLAKVHAQWTPQQLRDMGSAIRR